MAPTGASPKPSRLWPSASNPGGGDCRGFLNLAKRFPAGAAHDCRCRLVAASVRRAYIRARRGIRSLTMSAFQDLINAMVAGRDWTGMGNADQARELMAAVYAERYHSAAHHRQRYQVRANLQKKDEVASYAGWISADNPTSGAYQGISFVWFPGVGGSIAVLVIGTDGFGADSHILGRPGHARRLRALRALHQGRLWVKPDLLDLISRVPESATESWPSAEAAMKTYGHVIYAALPVRENTDPTAVEDLLDLFFSEHGTPLTGKFRDRWSVRQKAIAGAIFPRFDPAKVLGLLKERRFVILEGPPGTW